MRNTLKAVKKTVDDADKASKANMMQNVCHPSLNSPQTFYVVVVVGGRGE